MTYNATGFQLTHVLQQLYRSLGAKVTTATGGSTTTTIDTKLSAELEDGNEDDIYNGGTVIVIQDAGGANAAPEGEFARISDYEALSTTLTHDTLTAAVESGDRVIIAPVDYPLQDVIEVVNDALKYLGVIPVPDTSITSASEVNTLPIAAKGRDFIDVEFLPTGEVAYRSVRNWDVVPSAPGSTAQLILPPEYKGFPIRITYVGFHPKVKAFDDNISEYYHPTLVHQSVFAHVVQWRNNANSTSGGADPAMLSLEQKAWSQLDRAMMLYPVDLPKRRSQGMPHWDDYLDEDMLGNRRYRWR